MLWENFAHICLCYVCLTIKIFFITVIIVNSGPTTHVQPCYRTLLAYIIMPFAWVVISAIFHILSTFSAVIQCVAQTHKTVLPILSKLKLKFNEI